MREPIHINAGCCPWCKATKTQCSGLVTLVHPPESCCLPRAIWSLSWLHNYQHERIYVLDAQRIHARAQQMLKQSDNPAVALEQARKQAAEFAGTFNLAVVLRSLSVARQ